MYNTDAEDSKQTYMAPEFIKNNVVADTRQKRACKRSGAKKERKGPRDSEDDDDCVDEVSLMVVLFLLCGH
jgi:hypothetical protein